MIGSDHKASYRPNPERGTGESASERVERPAGGQVIRLFSGRERFYEPWEPDDE